MKISIKKTIGIVFGTLFLPVIFYQCKKMDDTYRQFFENGETIYVGKADSLKADGGNERVQLTWLLLSDPKVKSFKVYWDNRKDSLSGAIQKTDNVDTVRVIIDNLSEGTHFFEVYIFGDNDTYSVGSEVSGVAYGDIYSGSFTGIQLVNPVWSDVNDIYVELTAPATEETIGVEIEYDGPDGVVRKIVPADAREVDLPNVVAKLGKGELRYRTLFMPEPNAIDTFYTPVTTLSVKKNERELDKSKFDFVILDNDTYRNNYRNADDSPRDDRGPWLMWDNSTTANAYITESYDKTNAFYSITIDLGVAADLTKFKINQTNNTGQIYDRGFPKVFQIWGSNNPSSDGDWSKWTLMGNYEVIKPSGSPNGTNTPEDIAQAEAGDLFEFTDLEDNTFRYIRFKVTEKWKYASSNGLWINELTFWGVL